MRKRTPKASDSILERRDPEKSEREWRETILVLEDSGVLGRHPFHPHRKPIPGQLPATVAVLLGVGLSWLLFRAFPSEIWGLGVVGFALVFFLVLAGPVIIVGLILWRPRPRRTAPVRIGWGDSQKR
ncbi:MAG: hypothetical protein A3K65_02575 [Euryarchaeota archaeon RBG_16_68_12]|nr:MAG: hypothetical protein A3K65_02575 [Euryarchaeota archaeon RBG_16_68_12]